MGVVCLCQGENRKNGNSNEGKAEISGNVVVLLENRSIFAYNKGDTGKLPVEERRNHEKTTSKPRKRCTLTYFLPLGRVFRGLIRRRRARVDRFSRVERLPYLAGASVLPAG